MNIGGGSTKTEVVEDYQHSKLTKNLFFCDTQADTASYGWTQQVCANNGMEMPTFETAEQAEVFARLVYSGCL